jgi:hypothetical protein
MKVSGVNSGVNSTGKAQAKKTGAGGFASHLGGADEAEQVATVTASGITAINSLFMLQEVEDEVAPRKKAIKRGTNMLEYLDEIRLGLLSGSLSPDVVRRLDGLVKQWRENFNDPELEFLIDEIELRAAVELAKIESI